MKESEMKLVKEQRKPSPGYKAFSRLPLYFWRMGLGFLLGRIFMVLTTYGRKSQLPRHTMVEYHNRKGRIYVFSGHGDKSDWYKNLIANPRVTLQTVKGTETMLARRVATPAELATAFEFVESNPMMRQWVKALGFKLSREDFIANWEKFFLVTFDSTNEPTPPPLKADLTWVWLLVGGLIILTMILGRKSGSNKKTA
jgi:deazaflavin-dependent oxidoreductase (nitroreductase family)